MARFTERSRQAIDAVVDRWRDRCLVSDASLLFDEELWKPETIDRLHGNIIGSPETEGGNFIDRLQIQVSGDRELALLAGEALSIYYLFVSPGVVTAALKRERVGTVFGWAGESLDQASDVYKAFGEGIGGPGQYYLYRPDLQVGFILDSARQLKLLAPDARREVLSDHRRLRELVDQDVPDGAVSMRHVLLHLLAPDAYERIASDGHKRAIASTFAGLLAEDAPESVDDRLSLIRERLGELLTPEVLPNELDFYRPPLQGVWDGSGGEGVAELEALEIKKQLVLYGPPGTSKTFEAKALAERLIRSHALRQWGAASYFERRSEIPVLLKQRTRRLQLHPAYSYEEFIRGLRLREGKTVFEDGFLPNLVGEMRKETSDAPGHGLPWVLILDELNRADLSRVFGEAFSVLEDRGSPVDLLGHDPGTSAASLELPENLFVIGTMNLIDQSLEQVDFALRRRFLWFRKGFERQLVVDVVRERWLKQRLASKYTWELIAEHVNKLADHAQRLNAEIATSTVLGGDYEIGHTYFFDIVEFMTRASHLAPEKNRTSWILWAKNGEPRQPIADLWELSIGPLLAQYLQGVPEPTRSDELKALRRVLECGARS